MIAPQYKNCRERVQPCDCIRASRSSPFIRFKAVYWLKCSRMSAEGGGRNRERKGPFVFFFSLSSLEFTDTKVCAPETRARLGTTAHFCKAVALKEGGTCTRQHNTTSAPCSRPVFIRQREFYCQPTGPGPCYFFFFFITLGLEMSDTKVYEP